MQMTKESDDMRPLASLTLAASLASAPLAAQNETVNRIDLIRPDAPELAAFGAHPVGVTTLRFTNPDQIDIAQATADSAPRHDRTLTVEIWYPATTGNPAGGSYTALLRDGTTEVTLQGSAARDAAPASDTAYPLVILSHGYPGNRFLMAHLGENLASKGYVVAAIDHPDSTYDDQAAFGSTLFNRPWDQRFVLDSLAALEGDLGAAIDDTQTAIVGYSMGGYGALILAGAGVTADAVGFGYSPPQRLLERNMAGDAAFAELGDDRIKAVVTFAPWGRNAGFWDAAGLAAIKAPLLIVAGSADDVSVYSALREIFAETTGTTRHLLTFENANHNAGAPIPSPAEGWAVNPALGWAPFEHYADPVWDNVRMNNISAHFLTAFLDLHLKGASDRAAYLDLVPVAAEGVVARDADGTPTDAHSYWAGFPDRTALGLRFETLMAD